MPQDTASRYPRAVLDVGRLEKNISGMQQWCDDRGASLAPHVKTTMCREIVERQLDAGAVGITVATVDQAAAARDWGCERILIANEVLDPLALSTLHDWQHAGRTPIPLFLDSEAGVASADAAHDRLHPLPVVIDVGIRGGRTGVRDLDSALALAEIVDNAAHLRLAGVGGYEGVAPNVRTPSVVAAVTEQCRLTAEVFAAVEHLIEVDEPLFTMGGSAFPDLVLTTLDLIGSTRLVLRSGCYVVHDHGTYEQVSPLHFLRPATTVEALVLSRPESDLFVLGAGRRDLPYDAGPPIVLDIADAEVVRLFDHHTTVRAPAAPPPGSVVRLGISHPCSLFDRWSHITAIGADAHHEERWSTDFTRRTRIGGDAA